jgi:hypothetical protein
LALVSAISLADVSTASCPIISKSFADLPAANSVARLASILSRKLEIPVISSGVCPTLLAL